MEKKGKERRRKSRSHLDGRLVDTALAAVLTPLPVRPSVADEPGDSDSQLYCTPVTTAMTAASPGAQAAGKARN
ncbi:hypothetical protein INR49_013578, partial [Caranx melampygus]